MVNFSLVMIKINIFSKMYYMDKNTLVQIILFALVIYLFVKIQKDAKTKEGMTNTTGIAQADLDSIKTLADIAKKLQESGATNPGNLNTLGNLRVGNGATEWGNYIQLLGGTRDGGFIEFLNKDGGRNAYLQGKPNQLFTGSDIFTDGNIVVGNGRAEWSNLLKIYAGTKQSGLVEFVNKDGARNTFLMGNPQQLYTPNDFKADGSVIAGSVKIGNLTLTQAPDGGLRITTPTGWTDIGSKNDGWTHIYTDRPKFAFNKILTDIGDQNRDYMRLGAPVQANGGNASAASTCFDFGTPSNAGTSCTGNRGWATITFKPPA
jgi:hypothetical protein